MKIGLTLGKFLPFHRGHELLVQTAAAYCDHLCIFIGVSPDDPFSFEQRAGWVRKALDKTDSFTIIKQAEIDKNAPKDSEGTITDEKYWQDWLADTRNILKNSSEYITHVFTSDKYGERIAKEFGATWCPVDPDREIIPVSGTKVRDNLLANFKYLPAYVRQNLVKTVAIIGPESTGKSTLTKKLGEHFQCAYVPEYGRTVCGGKGLNLTAEDFRLILVGQGKFINLATVYTEVPLVITDTEALVTSEYYDMYFPDDKSSRQKAEINSWWHRQDIDLYIVMTPNVKWVNDGGRVQTEIQRWKFFYNLLDKLRTHKKNFQIVTESDFDLRFAKAAKYVSDILPKGFS